ncbi:putative enzyme related to lactoylglutathione lyase [Thermosporothrix hazakensis]|jgi:predicted enzyme related to lactoylglutathione lyase|uniref:Glyoxalase n=2 Tax=Thermosporothrix TaxID=768650 RepID=A0A455SKG6_9CHLR|nr:VOC family protein [Thermosporothrix hazakensis]PZW24080.1 putative enzyme related to lactoylglutathione lyase [Thermosporothrix hazakensis]BBH87868.1 glyoxalase [Thermosporothrix sp. COM3]GCE50293.1 glyoxalase [Thermosporothrix hazakensis]
MSNGTRLRGFATVNFYAADLEAAKQWYTRFLDTEPYFHVPGYIEFRLGDYQHEFGIIDSRYAPPGATQGPAGAIIYWHVDDIKATLAKLLDMGATLYQDITTRGEGFITASVVDPFGNILGIMQNAHYVQVLNERKAQEHQQ